MIDAHLIHPNKLISIRPTLKGRDSFLRLNHPKKALPPNWNHAYHLQQGPSPPLALSPSIGTIRDVINHWYGFSILMAIVSWHNAFSPCSQQRFLFADSTTSIECYCIQKHYTTCDCIEHNIIAQNNNNATAVNAITISWHWMLLLGMEIMCRLLAQIISILIGLILLRIKFTTNFK